MNIKLKDFNLIENINKVINEKKLSKVEVAKRLGKDQSAFIKKYTKKGNLSVMELYELCQILDYNFFADFCEFPPSQEILNIAEKVGAKYSTEELWEKYREEIVKNTKLQNKIEELEDKLAEIEEVKEPKIKAG